MALIRVRAKPCALALATACLPMRGAVIAQELEPGAYAVAPVGVQYSVRRRLVISGNASFYAGGRTTVNGRENLDLQRNSRVGLTLVRPVSRGRTLRLAISRGAYTTIGADFTSLSVGFQHVWGGH